MKLAGQYLGHYHVIRQIGRGGMGEVYLAEDSHVTARLRSKLYGANKSRILTITRHRKRRVCFSAR